MAKTKFLSKVLAVLMALSMLCSTGVFADYNSGLTAGDAAVTGTITATATSLNGKISFWGADTVEEAKWFDVTEGLNLKVKGTTDATTGTITYVVAPVGVLDQVPLDVQAMEAQSVAIGTADIANGEFTLEIEADAAKLVKDTTYELRLAYSKTEIADVTDASALVYQRYFKSFDWADSAEKATRTITKEGIGDITIDIEGNPIRSAAIDAVSTAAQYMREKQSVTHIRTADLKTGDPFQFSSSAAGAGMPEGFTWAGEEGDATRYTTTTTRRSMFTEVGAELRGGVVLAQGVAEPEKYFGAAQQSGNPAYRFKATQSGTVYVLGVGTTLANGWTLKDGSKVSSYYNKGSVNYLYTSKEVTAADLGAETVELAALQEYIVANTDLAVKTPDAPGYYLGGSKSNLYKPTSVKYYAANTAYITPDGYFQAPAANLDENDEWIRKTEDHPYNMIAITNYGYTNGRGWLTQERPFDHVYARDFEAGEWVEIPYTASVAETAKTCAVVQFDIPVAPLASATVTTAKTAYDIDALPMLNAAEVAFENGEYVIEVPRGTNTASFTVANANGAESEAVEVTMDAPSKVVKATIGDAEYDITVKFDDEYPSLYALTYGQQYGKAARITVQYGDMNTAATLKFTAKATNATSGVPFSGVTFAGGAEKPAVDKNLVVIGTPAANSGMSHMTTSTFGWLSKTTNNGTTFEVSAPATVYAKSVAFGNVAWPTIEALDWEVVGTFNGYNLYAKHFAAGETVQIPTQPITQAELDAKNATLTNGTMYAFITEENKALNSGSNGAVGDVILWNHTDGTITSSAPIASGDNAGRANFYVRPSAADTAFYAVFDSPLALGEVTYSVDGGDADAITFAEDEFTKTIEVPYDATSVSVAATKSGTGTVAVSEALDLTSAASGTVTVTLTAPGGTPVVYTINFVKGAPKILWESALALTGAAANPGNGVANAPVYSEGIYRLAEQSGAIDLSATEVDLEVAYGTEAVVLNDEVTISLLDNNGEGTGVITINGTDYTVNVSWKAFDAATMTEKSPLLYDLTYHGDAALVNGTYYNVVPTRLTLNADTDLEYGVGDVTNTMGTADTADDKTPYKEGEWFYRDSHAAANLQSVNAGGYLGRLHLAGEGFTSLVTTGDIDDKYALDGATLLVAHYKDTVANNAERYSFKSAVNGYVIVGSANANAALTAEDGWKLLDGAKVVTSNITTSGNSTNYVFQGGTKQVVTWATAFDKLYIKKVSVGDEVVVAESTVKNEVPPLVIVATEDMINERIAAPTVLESLSYTTALAVTEPKESVGANGHSASSLHANGFYQPSLVTEAETVAVAADATTVTVTVPYGSEIVNLAGVDNYDGAVAFDAINLINNNGAATVTTTVGEVEYTINVAWAAYDASADAAGNHIYDVKYRIKDLANTTYYNIVPTKLVLTENRIAPMDVDGYIINKSGAYVLEHAAGEWYNARIVGGAGSNLLTHNNGGQINRGRATLVAFDGWVRNGLVTASGFPGAALPAEATDAEVDAIAYNAMNGATTLVAHYTDYTSLDTAAGANAAMAEHLTFKVAQDSIVYVSSSSSSIGAEWTKVSAGKLYLHNQVNSAIYGKNEDDTYTELFKSSYIHRDYSAGGYAYYRYAKAGDTVSLTLNKAENNMPPVVLVRPIDFSAAEAPVLAPVTYTIGSGEATAVEFDGTTATIEVPWGTTDAIALQAALASGQGGVSVSDALTLSNENPEGVITVTLTDILGEAAGTYTVNFVWGAAPEVEAITYSTARTLYKGAVEKDAALTTDETEITVPWGTASVTVSYKMEDADAVALDAVSFVDGEATVEVPLPTGTVTYTFTYGDAPAGQYITGLTKVPNSWRDRMFVSYGDVDNAFTEGATKYATSGSVFFADDDVYSYRLPYGVAKKGYTAVIADAAANHGQQHMTSANFPYAFGNYPATEAANAWMTFTVAKAGTVYVSPASRDEAWAEGEALGWTEAPFTMVWGAQQRKVYQKRVAAGELVLLPNNKVTAQEVALYNETLTDVQYVQITAEQAAEIEAAAVALHGEGYNTNAVVEGDWIAYYTEEYLTANPDTVNYAGAQLSKVDGKEIEIMHYVRENNAVTFVVADEFVDDAARVPKYTGSETLDADGSIELTAAPAAYAEKDEAEITFAIKSGAEYATLEGTTLRAIRSAWIEGAAVVIEITQGERVSEATINVAPVEANKYGYLTVLSAEGEGSVTGKVGEDIVIEDATEGAAEFLMGEVVTLTATAAEDSEFVYWVVVNGTKETVYSRTAEINVQVPYGITLKPVFKKVVADSYTVTFLGYQDAVIATYDVASIVEDVLVTPDAPEVYGHKFVEYVSLNTSWKDTYGEGVEISKALFNRNITFRATYIQDDTMTYTVTVVGGTFKDEEATEKSGIIYNTQVIVVAGAPETGMKFQYWKDSVTNQTLSYDAEYKFYMPAANRTVEACYVEEATEVAPAPVVSLTVTAVDEAADGGPIYGLYAERRVPEGYTVVESGIVYGYVGNNYGLTAESDYVDVNNYNGKSTSKYQNNNGQYTVRLQMTDNRQSKAGSWYASAYLIYRDSNGYITTTYSPKTLVWEKL